MRARVVAIGIVDVVRAGKGITLVNSNEDMNDITRIIKSLENSDSKLENSGILIDAGKEAVKHERKNKKMDFLAYY